MIFAAALPSFAATPIDPPVTPAAVWRMPDHFVVRMHKHCNGRVGSAFSDCFVAQMARSGAAHDALVFTGRIGNEGVLAALSNTKPVAAGLVVYPFRANENDVWMLLNGSPPLIDVDDQKLLAWDALKVAPVYRSLLARYPGLSLWPDSRGAKLPQPMLRKEGGQRFLVAYQLHDSCHACEIVGKVRFAFDFDRAGKFLGTRLISVIAMLH